MKSLHSELIEFQYGVLRNLSQGVDSSQVSENVRDFVKSFYNQSNDFELGMSVNDVCNLLCEHCYYASTHDKSLERRNGNLSSEEWTDVINQSMRLNGVRHFSIVGKEPLLTPKITKGILEELELRKKIFPEIKYELITNGHFIDRNIDWLRDLDFYFFSVSFDGYQECHDNVRGEGSYEIARRGLELANDSGIKNLTITHTSMPQNVDSLEEMMKDLSQVGAKYFSIGFCFPTNYNKRDLTADLEVFDKVVDIVIRNENEDIDVSINLSGEDHSSIIGELYRRGDISLENLAVTSDFAPALILPLTTNPRSAIQFNVLPITYYGGMRIDCTGDVLDYCSDLRKPETRNGFGNIRTESLSDLWKRSQSSMWTRYSEKFYERLQKDLIS